MKEAFNLVRPVQWRCFSPNYLRRVQSRCKVTVRCRKRLAKKRRFFRKRVRKRKRMKRSSMDDPIEASRRKGAGGKAAEKLQSKGKRWVKNEEKLKKIGVISNSVKATALSSIFWFNSESMKASEGDFSLIWECESSVLKPRAKEETVEEASLLCTEKGHSIGCSCSFLGLRRGIGEEVRGIRCLRAYGA